MHKTVQLNCSTKVFYVTAFGFLGCILLSPIPGFLRCGLSSHHLPLLRFAYHGGESGRGLQADQWKDPQRAIPILWRLGEITTGRNGGNLSTGWFWAKGIKRKNYGWKKSELSLDL